MQLIFMVSVILAEGIETYKQNYTRFLVVGNEEKGNRKGDKVSICFSTGHKPGSLAAVLVILANLNINLSKDTVGAQT
jgi:prephenate dehydratase